MHWNVEASKESIVKLLVEFYLFFLLDKVFLVLRMFCKWENISQLARIKTDLIDNSEEKQIKIKKSFDWKEENAFYTFVVVNSS